MNKFVQIVGNTYPVKDRLKDLGARWNGASKFWTISADKAVAAQHIVDSQGLRVAPRFLPDAAPSRRWCGRAASLWRPNE